MTAAAKVRWFMCPVRGHDHPATVIKTVRQVRTGKTADLFECPTGKYRWLVMRDRFLTAETPRMVKPRYGWRHDTR